MALDLNKNNVAEMAEAGYEFELIVPGTVEGTGAFITVRGSESKSAREFARKKFKEMQRAEAMAKKRGKEVPEKELEDIEYELLDLAVTRIIDWRGITEGDKEVPFTAENAKRIMSEHNWIRDEALKNSNEIENFRL